MNRRQSLGRWGENLAAEHLAAQGYTILARNVRTPHGEIDLIAFQPAQPPNLAGTLVFVEVRTRASAALGAPELSVNPAKQEHIRLAVAHTMQQHPELAPAGADWRVDVIAIQRYDAQTPAQITHFENAFA
jgi:putative endonuclease